MAPALTKILKDGHGIHLSSCPASVRLVSAMCSTELESQMKWTDDGNLQMMWQNLPLFLDSCLPLDMPTNSVLSQHLQESASQCETVPPSSPASLFSLLSSSEVLRDHQVASVFPGVPDMCLVPEHNGQELKFHECGPDGVDMHPSPLTLTRAPPLYSHGEKNNQCYTPGFTSPPVLTQETVTGMGCRLSSEQPCSDSVNSDQLPSRVELGEAVKEQLSRQAGLQNRAQGLQRTLQALLGEHALLHCNQQLEGLKRHCELACGSLESLDTIQSGILPLQVGRESHFSLLDESATLSCLTEVKEFSLSSQLVLRALQEALDSEATASSSSDEEQEEDMIYSNIKTSPVSSCERRWLEERAELGSSWSWLQLRLVELEGRIQQLVELHECIRSTKGGVVLAESQPLTDRQVQQMLLREVAGLSCRALDADPDSCSPTRLLHNIERQSAQLSQLVNSLMPPLSFSPLSKQPHSCNGKIALTSGQSGDCAFGLGSCKRRRLATRRLKAGVCARTRPLLKYHKPRLFTLTTFNPSCPQDLGKSTSTLSFSLSTSSCSCCSSCNSVVLCSDPDCSTTPQPVRGHSLDTRFSHHLKRTREEWCQRPLVINAQPCGPAHYIRHKYKQYAGDCKSRVIGLSPFGMAGSAQSQHRRARQRKRKRRQIHRLIEDKEDILYQLCDIDDSSDEVLKQGYTEVTHKEASQGFLHKRQGVSMCDINKVVIPLSLAKVEKLQYKNILTPNWRVVETSPLTHKEAENMGHTEEGQVEDLTDEVFAKRHLASEHREKLRWGFWGKRKYRRRPKRSGSRLSGSGGGTCTSGEESSMESCAPLDADEQQSSEEWLPQTSWKPRTFPLDDDDEDALLSDNTEVPSGCSSAPTKWKNSNSLRSPAQSCGATLPSGGQNKSRTQQLGEQCLTFLNIFSHLGP